MNFQSPKAHHTHRQKQSMVHQIKDLPQPEPSAQERSERLIRRIQQLIEGEGGRISFAEYMSLVLYAPGLGYYSAANQKFGKGGDFVTAPEISPMFSRCLARQCQQVLGELKRQGEQQRVVFEVGGGSGIMAADVLAELEHLDGLPTEYWVLELSAELQQRQRQTITAKVPHLLERVRWLNSLPSQVFTGIVLANELLDAMPVHRFYIPGNKATAPGEYYVSWRHDRFEWQIAPPTDNILQERIEAIARWLAQNQCFSAYESEINLAAEAWVKTLAERLHTGMLLLIDYGFPRREYYHPQRASGTLMCHYRHRSHPDPFVYPGLQDITAHVDFTAIAEAAVSAGLHVAGYNTQGFFLLATGIEELLGEVDPNNVGDYLRLSQQVKTLTLPGEMGELFKVMALTKNIETPLRGFALQDLRNRL
jgi:SAM-dependent MidA family methyltransferase